MKRVIALGVVVLAGLLGGCGNDSQQQSSDPAASAAPERPSEALQHASRARPASDFKTPGAPARPPSYEQGKAAAEATGRVGDTYVHAHLDMGWMDHCLTNGQLVDWATPLSGACYGNFKGGGTEPFTGGRAAWSPWSKQSRDSRISVGMRTMHLSDEPAVSNVGISCWVDSRASRDCYTDGGSHLQLTVDSGDYVLLRGMCKDGDQMCTPRQSPSRRPG